MAAQCVPRTPIPSHAGDIYVIYSCSSCVNCQQLAHDMLRCCPGISMQAWHIIAGRAHRGHDHGPAPAAAQVSAPPPLALPTRPHTGCASPARQAPLSIAALRDLNTDGNCHADVLQDCSKLHTRHTSIECMGPTAGRHGSAAVELSVLPPGPARAECGRLAPACGTCTAGDPARPCHCRPGMRSCGAHVRQSMNGQAVAATSIHITRHSWEGRV